MHMASTCVCSAQSFGHDGSSSPGPARRRRHNPYSLYSEEALLRHDSSSSPSHVMSPSGTLRVVVVRISRRSGTSAEERMMSNADSTNSNGARASSLADRVTSCATPVLPSTSARTHSDSSSDLHCGYDRPISPEVDADEEDEQILGVSEDGVLLSRKSVRLEARAAKKNSNSNNNSNSKDGYCYSSWHRSRCLSFHGPTLAPSTPPPAVALTSPTTPSRAANITYFPTQRLGSYPSPLHSNANRHNCDSGNGTNSDAQKAASSVLGALRVPLALQKAAAIVMHRSDEMDSEVGAVASVAGTDRTMESATADAEGDAAAQQHRKEAERAFVQSILTLRLGETQSDHDDHHHLATPHTEEDACDVHRWRRSRRRSEAVNGGEDDEDSFREALLCSQALLQPRHHHHHHRSDGDSEGRSCGHTASDLRDEGVDSPSSPLLQLELLLHYHDRENEKAIVAASPGSHEPHEDGEEDAAAAAWSISAEALEPHCDYPHHHHRDRHSPHSGGVGYRGCMTDGRDSQSPFSHRVAAAVALRAEEQKLREQASLERRWAVAPIRPLRF